MRSEIGRGGGVVVGGGCVFLSGVEGEVLAVLVETLSSSSEVLAVGMLVLVILT